MSVETLTAQASGLLCAMGHGPTVILQSAAGPGWLAKGGTYSGAGLTPQEALKAVIKDARGDALAMMAEREKQCLALATALGALP